MTASSWQEVEAAADIALQKERRERERETETETETEMNICGQLAFSFRFSPVLQSVEI